VFYRFLFNAKNWYCNNLESKLDVLSYSCVGATLINLLIILGVCLLEITLVENLLKLKY
jgi:hypothetical protein